MRSRRGFLFAVGVAALAALGVTIDTRSAFDRWCDEVDAYFVKVADWPRSYTHDTGRDCWREWFDEGLSSKDAALEEISHWEA